MAKHFYFGLCEVSVGWFWGLLNSRIQLYIRSTFFISLCISTKQFRFPVSCLNSINNLLNFLPINTTPRMNFPYHRLFQTFPRNITDVLLLYKNVNTVTSHAMLSTIYFAIIGRGATMTGADIFLAKISWQF